MFANPAPFKSITLVDLGDSPACVNRKTRELYLNANTWQTIQPEHRVFIMLHEYAHCVLDSSNEELVDALAFEWYIELGYSLTEAVKSLTRILNTNNQSHIQRAELQLKRAKMIDSKNNKNMSGNSFKNSGNMDLVGRLNTMGTFIEDSYINSCTGNTQCGGSLLDSLTGCQAGETVKACTKRMKREGIETSRINKSEAKRLRAEAEVTLAEQGIVQPRKPGFGESFGAALGGIGKVASNIFGKGEPASDGGAMPQQPQKSNTALYVGLGVGGLLLIVVAVIFLKK